MAEQKSAGWSIGRGKAFVTDSWAEMKKVSYPTRQETLRASFVVLVFVVIMALYLGLLDLMFNQLMKSVLG